MAENAINYYDLYILEGVNRKRCNFDIWKKYANVPTLFNVFRADRLYMRYSLTSKPLEFDRLNNLIQTCVESGILQFYRRWELHLRQLSLRRFNDNKPQINSDIITMDHLWIYVYGYFLAMGLCTMVFVGEILHFHRARIMGAMGRVAIPVWQMPKRVKCDVCLIASAASISFRKLLKRVRKRIFPYSVVPTPHRLMHANRIVRIQRA